MSEGGAMAIGMYKESLQIETLSAITTAISIDINPLSGCRDYSCHPYSTIAQQATLLSS